MDAILKVETLQTHFIKPKNIVRAVDGISFSLKKGQALGIVGESGSGKTITALSIMRLLPSASAKIVGGSIIYCDQDQCTDLLMLSSQAMESFRGNKIGLVFQEPMSSFNPIMRCGKQLEEAIRIDNKEIDKNKLDARVLELLEEVQLTQPKQILSAYPHQLSGGQLQRLMIAIAISRRPRILIADEPTTSLDVSLQKGIINLLKNLQNKYGLSLLFISHDLGVIAEIADRVLVMRKGKIVESGNLYQIFNNPKHPYSRGLIACRPPMNRKLDRLPLLSDFVNDESYKKPLDKAENLKETKLEFGSKDLLVEVNHLSKVYHHQKSFISHNKSDVSAVDDVSFQLYRGEILGLVGESGSGKSTIANLIAGLIKPTSGQIIYDGKDISTMDEKALRKVRKRIQIIFQDPYSSLTPHQTIGEAVVEAFEIHNICANKSERKDKAIALLENVGLSPKYYKRFPNALSGGQLQRACIARALAVEPEFIICDEPVSSLDVSIQAQVLNLLKDLRVKYQLSYLFISHDLSVVYFMSDHVLVMQNGKIIEKGEAESIFKQPKHPYTKDLIASIPSPKIHRK